jgi:hypothetical protein
MLVSCIFDKCLCRCVVIKCGMQQNPNAILYLSGGFGSIHPVVGWCGVDGLKTGPEALIGVKLFCVAKKLMCFPLCSRQCKVALCRNTLTWFLWCAADKPVCWYDGVDSLGVTMCKRRRVRDDGGNFCPAGQHNCERNTAFKNADLQV